MKRSERRRIDRAIRTLPDAIELIVLAIRAGLSPSSAIEAVGDQVAAALRPTFTETEHRLHRGQRLADALDAFVEQLGPAAAGFSDALATADRYGLPIEPVLDRLVIDVRTARHRQAERHARTLPVRLAFPLVVCTLPSFVLLAIVPAVMGALSTLRGSLP